MKTKKFGKKLELNKTTITNLDEAMMKNALGGNAWETDPGNFCSVYGCHDTPVFTVKQCGI